MLNDYQEMARQQMAAMQISALNCRFGQLGVGIVSQASYGMTREQLEAINNQNKETTIRQDLEAYLKDWKE